MDLNQFYRADKSGQYEVTIKVRATVRETIKAASVTEAREKALAMIERGEIEVFERDVDDAEIWSCAAPQPMYLIERPGSNITGTSHPQPGDVPRKPTSQYDLEEYAIPPTTGPLAPA